MVPRSRGKPDTIVPGPHIWNKRIPVTTFLRGSVILCVLVGVLAFIGLNSKHLQNPKLLPIAIAAETLTELPADAHRFLKQRETALQASNHRSQENFWLLAPKVDSLSSNDLLVFGDKTLRHVELWAFDQSGQLIASHAHQRGDKRNNGRLTAFDQGYAYRYETTAGRSLGSVLLRVRSVGNTKFSIGVLSKEAFATSLAARERLAAGLIGALLALAAFTAVIASFTQSTALAACAAWIVALLAVTSISLGYDMMWLDYESIPAALEGRFKQLILALALLSNNFLHKSLFRRELAQLGYRGLGGVAWKISAIGLPVTALILPMTLFIPAFWTMGIFVLGYIGLTTFRIARRYRTSTVLTFSYSWGFITACLVAEISYAAGLAPRIPGISFETGAIFGAFMAASAAATSFRTERRRRVEATDRARKMARLYRDIYSKVPSGLISLDAQQEIRQSNPAARRLLGSTDLEGRSLDQVVGPRAAMELLRNVETFDMERSVRTNHGKSTLSMNAISTRGGVEIAITDVSAMARLQESLVRQANYDFLTGTLSWHGLSKVIEGIQTRIDEGAQFLCLHINLDSFSTVNKLYGRKAGDEMLRLVAQRVRNAVTPNCHVGRIGNDEFVVLSPAGNGRDPYVFATDIAEAISGTAFKFDAINLRLTTSLGVAFANDHVMVSDAILHAQRASDEARSNGVDTISVFDTTGSLNERLRNERHWDRIVREDGLKNRIEIWAQPIVPLTDASLPPCLEVLIRVRDENNVIQGPMHLLDAAQRHGIMPSIDLFVLEHTLQLLNKHRQFAQKLGYVSVNLSGASLNNRNFLGDLRVLLTKYPDVVSNICLEITESIALLDLPSTKRFTEEMSTLSVRIALDDFGSGYTSFAYLRSVPAQILKLDGSFIRGLEREKQGQALVGTMVSMSHALGMHCVAEWVETDDTARALAAIGCDYAQGFFFAKPMPASEWLDHDLKWPLYSPAAIPMPGSAVGQSRAKVTQT